MRRLLFTITTLLTGLFTASAADTAVTITYNGSTATVSIPSSLSSLITCSSGTSSHVKIAMSDNVATEYTFNLSGSSTDGEFYLEGSYKCVVALNGLTLTNPSGPAINIQNGKRIEVSSKNGTTNTLTDGANDDYKGCYNCKGHTKFKGKGTLNIVGNNRHAIYSKEYVEVKNCTLNITKAQKDGIHCQEYFLMESGTVNISGTGDDGIQVELKGETSTGVTTDHEDEDTGNFYMADGTLTISNYGGKAVKADGSYTISGGTQSYPTSAVEQNAATSGISSFILGTSATEAVFDLNGHRISGNGPLPKGIYIIRKDNRTTKMIVK